MSWTLKMVDGDQVRLSSNTGYEQVTGLDKLKQECEMVLTTEIRRNGIGSSLDEIIGRSVDGEPDLGWSSLAMFQFQQRVRDGLSRYRYVQRNFQFSRRTPKELLSDFSPVNIWADEDDPRNFRWRVDFFTLGNLPTFSLEGSTR